MSSTSGSSGNVGIGTSKQPSTSGTVGSNGIVGSSGSNGSNGIPWYKKIFSK